MQGDFELEQGFARLLQGSGLRVQQAGEKRYVLIIPEPANALELGATSVTSSIKTQTTETNEKYTLGVTNTSTKLNLSPRETPQSISIVSRKEIDDFKLNSIAEVLQHTPGVTVLTLDTDRTQYIARGFTISRFMYDGIPSAKYVSSYAAGQTLATTSIYDHVEVLKGSTGLVTGSGRPGAVINLVRKKPTKEFHGHLDAGYGSWDSYTTELDISNSLNESQTIRGRFVTAYQDKNSYQDHYKRETNVYYGILEFDLGQDMLLTLGSDYQRDKPQGSSWGGNLIFDSNGNYNKVSRSYNNGASWSRWDQYSNTTFAKLESTLPGDWSSTLQISHQVNGYDAELAAIGEGNPNPDNGSGTALWLAAFKGKTETDVIDSYLSGHINLLDREHEVIVGASASKSIWSNKSRTMPDDYQLPAYNYYSWNGDITKPNWIFYNKTSEKTTEQAAYITTRLNVTDDLKLIIGGRSSNYTSETAKESGVFVPYGGVIYDLNENYSVYGSYTSIFDPQENKDAQGKNLAPLEGDSYEIGVKGSLFDNRLDLSLAYFKIIQNNYAELTGVIAPDGSFAYKATQGVITKGFELEMAGEITPEWSVHAGLSHKIARASEEKVSTEQPENQFNIYTTYDFHGVLEGLTLGGGARWQGKSWAAVNTPWWTTEIYEQKPYWIFDLMSNYKITNNISTSVNIKNVLDKKYHSIFSAFNQYSYGEPRNITASLRWDF